MFKKRSYPENITYVESFLCSKCIFKDEPIFCMRLQTHKYGCAIINSRLINDKNPN